MFLRFVEFWETHKPKLIETEVHLFSDELKVAGTCDMVCEINDELWVIDFKTSNQIQTTYELQTAVYSQCYKECYGKESQRNGILWLNVPSSALSWRSSMNCSRLTSFHPLGSIGLGIFSYLLGDKYNVRNAELRFLCAE